MEKWRTMRPASMPKNICILRNLCWYLNNVPILKSTTASKFIFCIGNQNRIYRIYTSHLCFTVKNVSFEENQEEGEGPMCVGYLIHKQEVGLLDPPQEKSFRLSSLDVRAEANVSVCLCWQTLRTTFPSSSKKPEPGGLCFGQSVRVWLT